ncbi:ly6/PLAUR domain-containing protein 6B-like [Bacillus rossius redtenbacheri]|uniref:ly6/PLAUR domain-containing protein 6B-like n=1 Tax=Bacillus rossius redtenbacheri TaxID=93214 RepID=UPI002FDDBDD1
MLSAQCGWVLGCLVFTLLHQRAQAAAAAEGTLRHSSPEETTADPDSESVTCYTCVNVSDNLVCNRFAIDRPCPQGEDFCHTLHIMDSRGHSVIVNKKCTDRSECSPKRVGCLDIDTQKVCVSCCDEMYCNESAPSNHTTATYSATRARRREQRLQRLGAPAGGGCRHGCLLTSFALAALARA